MRLVVVIFATVTIFLSSCGIVISTSSINKAEVKREKAFYTIVSAYGDDVVDVDDFGNKSLSRTAADQVFPLESRKAAYFFYKGDAYLAKAYDFRSRSWYDDAKYVALKSEEFFDEALKVISAQPSTVRSKTDAVEQKTDSPADKKEKQEVKIPEKTDDKKIEKPVKQKEEKKPVEKKPAEQKEEKKPAVEKKPAEQKEEKKPAVEKKPAEKKEEKKPAVEEKPSLKGDPFEEKAEEPEPEKKEKQPSYYDVYEEMRKKYLKKQEEEKSEEEKEEKKEEKKEQEEVPEGGAK